jgi:deoxyuridine 5'-triphosphate nucleotidohydrolase
MKVVKIYENSQFSERNDGDLGFDLHAIVLDSDQYHVDEEGKKYYNLEPGDTKVVDLGVKIGFDKGVGGFLKERSGLASKGIHILGGVIDNTYTGLLKAVVYNSGKKPFKIYEGDRICQMVLISILKSKVEYVESLEETNRNDRGFGSSGGFSQ